MGQDPQGRSGSPGGLGGVVERVRDAVDRYQRRHTWAAFTFGVVKQFGDDEAGKLAALIAYYGFFSVFPLLLALVAILGFLLSGNPALQERILDTALANFPVIGEQLRENIGTIDGSGTAVVFGLLALLWAGLGAVEAAETSFNSVWDVPRKERPNFVSRKLRGFVMLAVLGLGTVLTTLLAGFASGLSDLGSVARLLGLVVSLVVNVALFLFAFKVLTNVPARWQTFLPGALVAGTAFVVLQTLGGWLVSTRLQGASDTYGTFAAVIALLTWLYLQAQITLLAAEINVVKAERLWPRSLNPEHLTEADRRSMQRAAEETELVAGADAAVHIDEPEPREADADEPEPREAAGRR